MSIHVSIVRYLVRFFVVSSLQVDQRLLPIPADDTSPNVL